MSQAIFLIGMPGAGKSTLGVSLAKNLARPFIDTDLLIQSRVGMSLQAYLDAHGYLALREIEENVLLEHDFGLAVVATGGSVIYAEKGMSRLGALGVRVFIDIKYSTMVERVNNAEERGLACAPGTSMLSLYEERRPLYIKHADIIVSVDNMSFDMSLNTLQQALL